jgi:thioredoxin 1/putative thioredoxin
MKRLLLLSVLVLAGCIPASSGEINLVGDCQLSKGEDILIIYSADWCGYCQRLKKKVEKLQSEIYFEYKVIDVDNYGDFKCKYKGRGIPASVYFEDGMPKRGRIGDMPVKDLRQFIYGRK